MSTLNDWRQEIPAMDDADASQVTVCTRDELAEFMALHNSTKQNNIDKIMVAFAGRDTTLLQMLFTKYGDVPPVVGQGLTHLEKEKVQSRKREMLDVATQALTAETWARVNDLLRKANEALSVDTIQQLAACNQKLIDVLVAFNNPAQSAMMEYLQEFLAREDVQEVLAEALVPMGREITIAFRDSNLGLGLTGGLNQNSQSAYSTVIKDFPRRLSKGVPGTAEAYNARAPPRKQLVPGMVVVKVANKSVEGLSVNQVVNCIKTAPPPRLITFDYLATIAAGKRWAEEHQDEPEDEEPQLEQGGPVIDPTQKGAERVGSAHGGPLTMGQQAASESASETSPRSLIGSPQANGRDGDLSSDGEKEEADESGEGAWAHATELALTKQAKSQKKAEGGKNTDFYGDNPLRRQQQQQQQQQHVDDDDEGTRTPPEDEYGEDGSDGGAGGLLTASAPADEDSAAAAARASALHRQMRSYSRAGGIRKMASKKKGVVVAETEVEGDEL
jgi:hypothetical protein